MANGDGQAQTIDWQSDPDFHGLPLAEKHKALMAMDPDYRGMPPSEQAKALDEIHYGQLGRDQSQFTGGTRNRIADVIEKGRAGAEHMVTGTMQRFGLPTNPAEVSHFFGQDPGQKPALSELIEAHARAGEKSPVGYVPLIGPGSVSAAEHGRKGEYGEMAGDIAATVAQISPLRGAGGSLSEAIGAAARTPEGALRPGLTAASELGGTLGGMGLIPEHPYIGAGIGYRTAPRLVDALMPERGAPSAPVRTTPFPGHFTEDVPVEGAQPGGVFPRSEEFYERRGADLMKRGKEQEALDTKAARKERLSDAIERSGGKATILPEGKPAPYRLTPEQVPGRPQLRSLAKGGVSEAGTELQRRGERVIYEPTGAGGGYPGPRSRTTYSGGGWGSEARPVSPREATAKSPGGRRASEKATTLSEKPKDLGPEWTEGQRQHEISRNKEILRNPKATAEDRRIAGDRLSEQISRSERGRGRPPSTWQVGMEGTLEDARAAARELGVNPRYVEEVDNGVFNMPLPDRLQRMMRGKGYFEHKLKGGKTLSGEMP